MTEPIRQIAHPIRPNGPSSSLRNTAANTALMSVSAQTKYAAPYQHAQGAERRN
jgi:hypothetical protein